MTDPREWIAQAKARCDAATPGPWTTTRRWEHLYVTGLTTSVAHVGACYDDGKDQPVIADAEHIAAARTDLPRALAALEAVLDLHQERWWSIPGGPLTVCDACSPERYPCPTVRAITAALDGAS